MNKAERNCLIIAALRKHGTIAGAARDVGVSLGTVKRLTDNNPDASEALVAGITDTIRSRLKHLTESHEEAAALHERAHAETEKLRHVLAFESTNLDYSAIRTMEKELRGLVDRERTHSRAAKARLRALRQATARALNIYGVTPDEAGEKEADDDGDA